VPWATTGTPTPPLISRHSLSACTSLVMSNSWNSHPFSLSQSLTLKQWGQVGVE
jgi:hypothetical protein